MQLQCVRISQCTLRTSDDKHYAHTHTDTHSPFPRTRTHECIFIPSTAVCCCVSAAAHIVHPTADCLVIDWHGTTARGGGTGGGCNVKAACTLAHCTRIMLILAGIRPMNVRASVCVRALVVLFGEQGASSAAALLLLLLYIWAPWCCPHASGVKLAETHRVPSNQIGSRPSHS